MRRAGIVRYFGPIKCPRCGRQFDDLSDKRFKRDKNGELIPQRFECDTCLVARIGKDGYEQYMRLKRAWSRGDKK